MLPIKQISSFGVVGLIATAVHVVVGLGLHDGIGLAPLVANFFGFCAALCVSFFGQTRFTFPAATANLTAFIRFASVALSGLALNQLIVWVMTSLLGQPYWLALIIILSTVPVVTFMLLKFWALRR
ncbi:MAG: GtrA family protein [Paracoccaceae bacterium]|nr:GtrA family protein [Paracoccaceae bacterium]